MPSENLLQSQHVAPAAERCDTDGPSRVAAADMTGAPPVVPHTGPIRTPEVPGADSTGTSLNIDANGAGQLASALHRLAHDSSAKWLGSAWLDVGMALDGPLSQATLPEGVALPKHGAATNTSASSTPGSPSPSPHIVTKTEVLQYALELDDTLADAWFELSKCVKLLESDEMDATAPDAASASGAKNGTAVDESFEGSATSDGRKRPVFNVGSLHSTRAVRTGGAGVGHSPAAAVEGTARRMRPSITRKFGVPTVPVVPVRGRYFTDAECLSHAVELRGDSEPSWWAALVHAMPDNGVITYAGESLTKFCMCERALEADYDNHGVWMELAELLRADDRLSFAAIGDDLVTYRCCLRRVVEVEPRHAEAWVKLGDDLSPGETVAVAMGRPEKAHHPTSDGGVGDDDRPATRPLATSVPLNRAQCFVHAVEADPNLQLAWRSLADQMYEDGTESISVAGEELSKKTVLRRGGSSAIANACHSCGSNCLMQ